jgi:hypothetical protein
MPEADIRISPHEVDIITACAQLCTVTARNVMCSDMELDERYPQFASPDRAKESDFVIPWAAGAHSVGVESTRKVAYTWLCHNYSELLTNINLLAPEFYI